MDPAMQRVCIQRARTVRFAARGYGCFTSASLQVMEDQFDLPAVACTGPGSGKTKTLVLKLARNIHMRRHRHDQATFQTPLCYHDRLHSQVENLPQGHPRCCYIG